ncbi:MAG: hypothetical protein JST13_11880, partial [Bacteroidetes bacterium]|nr:hypothetical protein [Bacteroidota bacterium]
MKKSLAGLLFFFATSISAQTHFSPGYVIKSNGDTLHGFLQEEFRPNILTSLQFKDTSSPIETFTPEELKSFAYERGGIYKSISFRNSLDATTDTAEICFALQLVEGNYNLFSFIRKGQTYFVIKGNGLSYFLYNDVTNGNGEVLVEGNYSSRLRSLGASCKQASLISQEIDYSEKQIAVFINKLNNCISPGTSSVNHFKEAKIDIRFAAFAGGIYIDRYRNQVTLDGAAVLTYPQLSRNMSVH